MADLNEIRRELEALRNSGNVTFADLQAFTDRHIGTQTKTQENISFGLARDFASGPPGTDKFEEAWRQFTEDYARFNEEAAKVATQELKTKRRLLDFLRKKNKREEESLKEAEQSLKSSRQAGSPYLIQPDNWDYNKAVEEELKLAQKFNAELEAREKQRDPAQVKRENDLRDQLNALLLQIATLRRQQQTANAYDQRAMQQQIDALQAEVNALSKQEGQDRSMLRRGWDKLRSGPAPRAAPAEPAPRESVPAGYHPPQSDVQGDDTISTIPRTRPAPAPQEPEMLAETVSTIPSHMRPVAPPTAQPTQGVPASDVLRAAAAAAGSYAANGLRQGAKGAWSLTKKGASGMGSVAKAGLSGTASMLNSEVRLPAVPASVHGFLFALIYFGTLFFMTEWGGVYYWQIGVLGMLLMAAFYLSRQFREEFGNFQGIMFFVFFLAHLYVVSKGFATNWQMAFMIFGAFVTIALIYYLLGGRRSDSLVNIILLVVVSTAFYAIPAIADRFLPETIAGFLIGALVLIPIGSIFMLRKIASENPDGYAAKLLWWHLVVAIGLLLGFFVTGLLSLGNLLPKGGFAGVDIQNGKASMGEVIRESYSSAKTRLDQMINQATNPGEYYTGQVEKNKEKPLGVTIENLRPQDKTINNETEIVVFGTVKARSFVGESITVVPTCVLDRKGAPKGTPDPVSMEVLFGSSNSFQCSFDPKDTDEGQWKRGSYPVVASATFPFETWSYITYSFVDEERHRVISQQGLDPHQVLNIPQQPTAIYTSGPLMVGMGGSEALVRIRPDDSVIVAPGTLIGFTLDNAWQNGQLQYVETWELKVPQPFSLNNCTRNMTQEPYQDAEDEEYTNYVFENPRLDPVNTYSSVTCRLFIDPAKRAQAATLVRSSDKAERSFIAVAHYQFTVDQRTTVTVR